MSTLRNIIITDDTGTRYNDLFVDIPLDSYEKTGDMIGLWKQVYEGTREDGTNYALEGIQGSWFKYGGNFEFAWQRDFFDYGNVSALFIEMLTKKAMSDEMLARVEKSAPGNLPGWYDFGTAPVKFW